MKTFSIDIIRDYLVAEENVSGHQLVRTFLEEQDKLTKVEAGYTERLGGRLQQCQTCDNCTPNGRDWGDCEKVQEAVWCLAHCRFWVMTGGQKSHS
mgnify:FL=1